MVSCILCVRTVGDPLTDRLGMIPIELPDKKIKPSGGGIRTHTGAILSRLSLPLDYTAGKPRMSPRACFLKAENPGQKGSTGAGKGLLVSDVTETGLPTEDPVDAGGIGQHDRDANCGDNQHDAVGLRR
jgi:hypothetical protein